jgi:hypothetical protein
MRLVALTRLMLFSQNMAGLAEAMRKQGYATLMGAKFRSRLYLPNSSLDVPLFGHPQW